MKLSNRVTSRKLKNNILKDIQKKVEPMYADILHNIKYTSHKEVYLPKIDIKRYFNISDDMYNLDSVKYSNEIGQFLISNNVHAYNGIISRFTPLSIIKTILNKHNTKTSYEFSYKTNKINIIVFSRKTPILLDLLNKAIKSLLFLEIFGFKNKEIKVEYYPTESKKKLDKNSDYIGISSVNSGFTTFKIFPEITIFRKEESDKVLIHEMVHLLELDFALDDNTEISNIILNDININKEAQFINFFEAYTDSIAIIFNSIFNCIITKTDIGSYFMQELLYLEDTVINILDVFDIKSIKELFRSKGSNMLIQKTSVLSYYILKYGLLLRTDLLLERFQPGIKWNSLNIEELYRLSINNLNKNPLNHNGVNHDSMRMSYNQLVYK